MKARMSLQLTAFWQVTEHWLKIIRVIILRFIREGFTYRTSALTYNTLLALVPLLAVIFSFISLFHAARAVGEKVQHYIFANFVPATGQVVDHYLTSFISQAAKLPPLGIIMLVVVAIMLMLTIERTFNDIWYVKVRRKGVIAFLRYWAIITLAPIFIGLSFAISSYIFSLSFVARTTASLGIQTSLLDISPFLLTTVALTILNIIVPNCKVKIRYGLLGGVVSAIFFELAKHGFATYTLYMSSYRLIYGAIAAIPIFLLWVYISWFIILCGALLAHAAATTEKTYKGPIVCGFLHAFLIMDLLWEAQQVGKERSLRQITHHLKGNFRFSTDIVLQQLLKSGLIKRTENSGFVSAYDCAHLSLYDFAEKVPWPLPHLDSLSGFESNRFKALHAILIEYNKMLSAALTIPMARLF